MSLLRTLASVAVGVAAARGAGALMNRADRDRDDEEEGLLDSMRRYDRDDTGGLGELLGGGSRRDGGLGGLMDQLGGSGALGGLGGLAGGLLTGGAAGGALGSLLGGGRERGRENAFGRRLNESLRTGREPSDPPTEAEEEMAALMIRAMIMAAKADGRIDGAERERLLSRLGDLDRQERRFVEEELDRRIDVRDFARDVPNHPGLRAQVFAAAMSAIDLDSMAERRFAEELAEELGVDQKARGTVGQRMARDYGTETWGKAGPPPVRDSYAKGSATRGGPVHGKTMQGTPGQGRPYRKG
ncbi:tellurite resistance TerB family protein [Roseibacterium beibuensis]|uniref:Tellurite resistance protein TerB n=1 Tax=[Roseibacterium] beibuensis TaxID=1193142 RepID=A0ABP9L096_9RHOB|nr:tellurite resistance TerB family protein [Roseibacterium beibuensis]MCS6621661.1 tellurite resistance TerB family protein [Roseibacterium beibuensis]